MEIYRLFRIFMLGVLLSLFSQAGLAAQMGPMGLAADEKVEQVRTPLADVVEAAADAGVQVILIDPNATQNNQQQEAVVADNRSGLAIARASVHDFRLKAQDFMAQLPMARHEMVSTLRSSSPDGTIMFFVKMLVYSLLLFAAGEIIKLQIYGKRIVGPWFIARQIENPEGYSEKLPILVLRFLLGVGGIAVTMLVAYTIGSLIFGPVSNEVGKMTIGYIYLAYGSIHLVALLWRMILSPFLPNYRIPQFHPDNADLCNKAARQLYVWLWIGAMMGISFNLFIGWLEELGVSYTITGVLNLYLTGFSALYSIAMVVANRKIISGAILLGQPLQEASLPSRIAVRFWAPLVILYFIIAWLDLAYNLINGNEIRIPLIVSFYQIILTVIVVYALVNYFIEQFFQRRRSISKLQFDAQSAERMEAAAAQGMTEGEEIFSSDQQEEEVTRISLNTYEDLATRVASLLAFIAGFDALLSIWNIDQILGKDSFLNRSEDVIFILFVGYIAYHVFRIWIDNKIAEEGGADELNPGDEGGTGGASRLATLLPLFRNFLLVVIAVSVVLIALTEMGINVTPLFAGAGVVGLAIGFGAQTLVRDVFSGAFFLFDDAFRKGEYVNLGDVKGTVEKVSVRSFQLRHHLGPLHTVPFGEIKFITNFSRDWVMMKLPMRVTYDTDVDRVRKLIKKLGQRLLEDPEIGHQFLQPLKSQGVIEMQDSAMIIRVKFMTKPGDQWVIRKRIYQEIRDLFAKEGIKFAHKEVTVRLADAEVKGLTEQEKKTIGGAALSAVDELVEEGQGGDDR